MTSGEEEADLGLAELVQKGEVAWLNASDAKKDEPARGRPGHADEYDEPSTSKGPHPSFSLLDIQASKLHT